MGTNHHSSNKPSGPIVARVDDVFSEFDLQPSLDHVHGQRHRGGHRACEGPGQEGLDEVVTLRPQKLVARPVDGRKGNVSKQGGAVASPETLL